MAFILGRDPLILGSVTVINNDGSLTFDNFESVPSISGSAVKITASDGAEFNFFGASVAIGFNRIIVGATQPGAPGVTAGNGATYIFDLDGNELAKITASDGAASDFFGSSVAVGSGRIVVGASGDDDNGSFSGSAYIFDLDGNELAKITASDGAADDDFSRSVAVGSGRIVVGAPFDDDAGTDSGSAYIFDLDGNELAKITASDAAASDRFGQSVSIGSGRIVVGAIGDDDNGTDSGSAYIYDLDGNELTKITASDGAASDNFGISVAIGSGRIVVGANQDDSAYIFDLDGNELTKITASDGAGANNFGHSVAVGSGRIVVGAYQDDFFGSFTGSAYIFDLDGNELTKIRAFDGAAGDQFGSSVAVGSGRIVVGSSGDDDNGSSSGSAYIYSLPGTSDTYWEKQLENISSS